jgi:hypothetical protein
MRLAAPSDTLGHLPRSNASESGNDSQYARTACGGGAASPDFHPPASGRFLDCPFNPSRRNRRPGAQLLRSAPDRQPGTSLSAISPGFSAARAIIRHTGFGATPAQQSTAWIIRQCGRTGSRPDPFRTP